jgi:hypothetical protein
MNTLAVGCLGRRAYCEPLLTGTRAGDWGLRHKVSCRVRLASLRAGNGLTFRFDLLDQILVGWIVLQRFDINIGF